MPGHSPTASAGLAGEPAADLPRIRVSAGIVSNASPDDLSTLLQRADSALYAAKRGGRDRTMPWMNDVQRRVAPSRRLR